MEEYAEQQGEEIEVLNSIYEGDNKFKQISDVCFQYMYGDDENKSLLVEISWPEMYPSVLPIINLDMFHNSYLPADFKIEIRDKLLEEANELLDSAMTYSIFDWLHEHSDEYLDRIPEIVEKFKVCRETKAVIENKEDIVSSKKEKKVQLTKAQKRRITERTNFLGERERGHDWVDIVKHLSQMRDT